MTKIEIELSEKYKSFNPSFSCSLEGDLIILTGVNGSGKSQFLEIIKQNKSRKNVKINLNGQSVSENQIALKSFKELINLARFADSIPSIRARTIETACNVYKKKLKTSPNLQISHIPQPDLYSRSIAKFTDILKSKYPNGSSNNLTDLEIEAAIPEDFIFQPDDIFSNNIIDIFLDFLHRRKEAREERGRTGGEKYDESKLGDSPWKKLNNLFSELDFSYRFEDSYELKNGSIKPQIQLTNRINVEDGHGDLTIQLNELSDGEKAIISLTFALIKDNVGMKMLLLDEYDATLNPSLTNAFFKVIENYFVAKNITVIMTTHSTDTLMLAPQRSSLYQIEKPTKSGNRIKKLEKEKYHEYKLVYQKYEENNSRILTELEMVRAELERIQTPLIITEGKTDVIHIKTAMRKLGISDLNIKFHETTDSMGESNLIKLLEKLSLIDNTKKIIGIFDRDNKDYINTIGDLKKFGNNVFAFCIPHPKARALYKNISIEFYYSDDEVKKEKNGKRLYFSNEISQSITTEKKPPKFYPKNADNDDEDEYDKKIHDKDIKSLTKDGTIISHSKACFARLIADEKDNFSADFCFDNFNLIIDKIKEIIEDEGEKVVTLKKETLQANTATKDKILETV